MSDRQHRFEQTVLPHLDAAYNLARWLTRNDHDAQDVVQDAVLRAFRFFDGFRGGEARPWLLAIVRNACFTWLRENRPAELAGSLDDQGGDGFHLAEDPGPGPEALAQRSLDKRMLNEAIAALPPQFREALVLRELEDLSYKDIARIIDVPIGTVMSRLARARRLLSQSLRVIVAASGSGVHG
ncbi:MAG: sigma-70 family RNA polymerase sigma factor [Burkholderiales bacterium]